jgi:hypothetical protein
MFCTETRSSPSSFVVATYYYVKITTLDVIFNLCGHGIEE